MSVWLSFLVLGQWILYPLKSVQLKTGNKSSWYCTCFVIPVSLLIYSNISILRLFYVYNVYFLLYHYLGYILLFCLWGIIQDNIITLVNFLEGHLVIKGLSRGTTLTVPLDIVHAIDLELDTLSLHCSNLHRTRSLYHCRGVYWDYPLIQTLGDYILFIAEETKFIIKTT